MGTIFMMRARESVHKYTTPLRLRAFASLRLIFISSDSIYPAGEADPVILLLFFLPAAMWKSKYAKRSPTKRTFRGGEGDKMWDVCQ